MGGSTATIKTAQATFSIILTLVGFRSGTGSVGISIFAAENREAFPAQSDRAQQTHYISLNGSTKIEVPLTGLADGTYAIAVMHDENQDGKLKTNFLGMPTEGFGFSNDPKIYFGAPSFDKAAVKLDQQSRPVIKMKYFL